MSVWAYFEVIDLYIDRALECLVAMIVITTKPCFLSSEVVTTALALCCGGRHDIWSSVCVGNAGYSPFPGQLARVDDLHIRHQTLTMSRAKRSLHAGSRSPASGAYPRDEPRPPSISQSPVTTSPRNCVSSAFLVPAFLPNGI